jgi:hypothetical protein
MDDEDAIPDQIAIASGSVNTVNSVTETLTDSLNKANVIAASLSATRTLSQSLTSGGTNQQTQSWSIAPTSDGDGLRRLQALYRFALDDNVSNLWRHYPNQQISYTAPDGPDKGKPVVDFDRFF